MLLATWAFIGMVAIAATGVALYTSDNAMAIITGLLGMFGWGMWSFGALNLQVVRDATVYQFGEPMLTIFGVALALVPGFIAINGPIEMVQRYRDPRPEEI